MKKKKNIIFFCIMLFSYTSYAKNTINNTIISNKNIYQEFRNELQDKKFQKVINQLEKFKTKNINNIDCDKIQINLIYAYYKMANFIMAKKNIKEFIQLYPKHPNIDYVLYIESLISISLDKYIYLNQWSIQDYKSNPIYAEIAFFQLKNLIDYYPTSIYVTNAKKDLFFLKKRLLKHELKILQYYFDHKKYIAVINRGDDIITKYSEIPEIITILEYMKKSFFLLKIFRTAEKISKIIKLNTKPN